MTREERILCIQYVKLASVQASMSNSAPEILESYGKIIEVFKGLREYDSLTDSEKTHHDWVMFKVMVG